MIQLPEIYSLELKSAVIDNDHILLPPDLAQFLPSRFELCLGDGNRLKAVRQEEVLSGKGLTRKLLSLGNLVQWEINEDTALVRSALPDGAKVGGEDWEGTVIEDPSHLLERVYRGEFCSLEKFLLAREAMELSVKPGFDQLLSFRVIQGVESYPHQVNTVRKVLRQMKGRALLCDEVGLGKTVEAGLVMMEYLLRGLVKRVLVLTPPSLLHQWQEEMAQKFNLDFVISDSPEFKEAGPQAWSKFNRIIASIHIAKRAEQLQQVEGTRFDLVIVDEAHHLRHRNTRGWKLINALDKKYILLLTATPVQNSLEDLFNLITLLSPGQLKTAGEFRKQFVARGDSLKVQNEQQLRALVSQVMIRNRRSSSGIVFTQRRAHTVRMDMIPGEENLYRMVTGMVRELYRGDKLPLSRLTLKTLQMEASSSPCALAASVQRLVDNGLPSGQQAPLQEILRLSREVSRSAKLTALEKTLESLHNEKVVVFTRYISTLHWLKDSLKNLPLAVYHGGLSAREKDEAVKQFQGEARILLSTDSGGEGRNLQFCHIMANFDLPWNPMRIEQRIGRLSRIGQQRDVYIFNLVGRGTVEEQVLEILERKINLFELVVGELDLILGRFGEEKDLEEVIMELVGTTRSDEELHEHLELLGEKLRDCRDEYEKVSSLEGVLFPGEER